MVQWVVKAPADCPVTKYVIHVVEEEESPDDPSVHRWLVEASEGQIQQLMRNAKYVSVTPWDTWDPADEGRRA